MFDPLSQAKGARLRHPPTDCGRNGLLLGFRVFGMVLATNILFALLLLLSAYADSAPVANQVRQAFASRVMLPADSLKDDAVRGVNSYNECLVLQMAVNDSGGILHKAFLPRVYYLDDKFSGPCEALRQIVADGTRQQLHQDIYSEYWQGYVLVASLLTREMGVAGMRRLLSLLTYGSLFLLFVSASFSGGDLALVGQSIAAVGATAWALPYYGQNVSFAPGDACLILGLVVLLLLKQRLSLPVLAAVCAIYGCVLTYLDFLTGQLPTAAGLTFALLYVIGRTKHASTRIGFIFAAVGLASLVAASVLTVVIKQCVVVALTGPSGIHQFVQNLAYYTGVGHADESGAALYVQAFRRLIGDSFILTNDQATAARILLASSALSWALALAISIRRRCYGDLLAFAAAAGAVPAWVMLMPRHTLHNTFMTRILIVPLALGLAILLMSLRKDRRRSAEMNGRT